MAPTEKLRIPPLYGATLAWGGDFERFHIDPKRGYHDDAPLLVDAGNNVKTLEAKIENSSIILAYYRRHFHNPEMNSYVLLHAPLPTQLDLLAYAAKCKMPRGYADVVTMHVCAERNIETAKLIAQSIFDKQLQPPKINPILVPLSDVILYGIDRASGDGGLQIAKSTSW